MNENKIIDMTDAYLASYMRAIEKTRNPNIATQAAIGVIFVLANAPQGQSSAEMGGAFLGALFAGLRNAQEKEDPGGRIGGLALHLLHHKNVGCNAWCNA